MQLELISVLYYAGGKPGATVPRRVEEGRRARRARALRGAGTGTRVLAEKTLRGIAKRANCM